MDWLEQNIDAYRILAELLTELRAVLASGLKEKYGASWATEGLPSSVFDELVQAKEDESAVDWYEDEYQELFNYTTFSQLLEILQASPDLFPCLSELVPTPSLLTARFMELEVLRQKVGRARPVGEVELNFLMKFHLHFRKALKKRDQRLEEGKEAGESSPLKDESAPAISDDPPEPLDFDPEPETSMDSSEDPPSEEAPSVSSFSGPRPPQRMATRSGLKSPDLAPPGDEDCDVVDDSEVAAPVETGQGGDPVESLNLASRLEKGDSLAILRELFLEVTKLAENLWSSDVPQTPTAWNAVRVSKWYEENFVSCGLRALSDFYAIVARVEERLETGLARHELQKLLEEAQFAQILLNLRDMFQKNGLHS